MNKSPKNSAEIVWIYSSICGIFLTIWWVVLSFVAVVVPGALQSLTNVIDFVLVILLPPKTPSRQFGMGKSIASSIARHG
jgi:hypothetical protein